MSLKYEIDSLDGIEENLKNFYEEKEGKYFLKLEGVPKASSDDNVEGMKKKIEELLNETKTAKQKAREIEAEKARALEEKARKEGDFKSLLESSEKEREKLAQQYQELIEQNHRSMINVSVTDLASKLCEGHNVALIKPHIASRLSISDGKVQVLDREGKPSVATLEDLVKEIQSDPTFASIVRGTRATGGSASGSNGRADHNPDTSKLSPLQKMQLGREKKR